MRKNALFLTFIFVAIPTLLVLFTRLFLKQVEHEDYYKTFLLFRDLFIIGISGVITYKIILSNNIKNAKNLEKIEKKNDEIRISKERYDIVSKATSDTIWDWNMLESKFYWNKGIYGIYGYAKNEVVKSLTWWFEQIHPDDLQKVTQNLKSIQENKTERWRIEYRFKCKDGSYKHVYERGFLIVDEKGNPTRMTGSMEDVTKKHQEEERLRLLETVITNMRDAVVILDPDISANLIPKIIFVNDAFCHMTGYSYEEVIGQSPMMFAGKKSSLSELDKLTNAIKNKEETLVETISYKKNGEQYWVKFSMIPIFNSNNELLHWISIQRDVTKRKNNEQERELLINEMNQNNKDLKHFSYITSHNLRAPLSNLIGLLKIIDTIPIENEELKLIIDGFSKSTHLLDETISDLNKVLLIKENESIEKQEISLFESLKKVFNNINVLISENKPKFNLEIPKEETIFVNRVYFESILLNLLTNAIKYKSKERPLEINISSNEEAGITTIVFQDNGIGIDLNLYGDKVFGLYQKFHNYSDSKGMGLYIVKSHVESMGGSIAIKSKVNVGTKFILKFKKNNV
jgi:PAS domain S-box-containing protein